MGAPVVAVSALARTKTGRRVSAALLMAFAVLGAALMAPLIAVPMMVASQNAPQAPPKIDGMPAAQGDWGYPLAGSYSTGRGFGWHPVEDCAYCPSDHLGYDMDQPCGATVYAAGPGEVINAGAMPGWGNTVRIDHGGGLVTLYGHMQWESLKVHIGQQVTAGTPLGDEGTTGKSTGCHLHFEVQLNGVAIDPEPFMAARGLPLR